jgi:hypothetical protein
VRDAEEEPEGARNVIVAIAPHLHGYEGLLESPLGPQDKIAIDLDPRLWFLPK